MPRKKNNGSKMICFYAPPWLHQSIKLLASYDGSTMQDWIAESLIETIKARGPEVSLPLPQAKAETIALLVKENLMPLMENSGIELNRLKQLTEGMEPSEEELNRLSELLEIELEELWEIRDRTFGEKQIGDRARSS